MASNADRLVAVTAVAFVLSGCMDLFHSTDDVRTACQLDADAPGCAPDAAVADAGGSDGGAVED